MAISGGRFSYRAREYTLPPSRGGRVVHGLVRDAPWTVERHWQDDAGDHLRAAHGHAGGMVELAPGATWRPWARITAERSRSVRDG
jgi:galactose mutarotase-like enzyme